jgi:hypothetical protein
MSKEKKPAAAPTAGPAGGEHKEKGGQQGHGGAPAHSGGGAPKGGNVGAKVGCLATGCKDKDVRANFCEEHFRQYKFGLITKMGEKVLDYEKKFEHYQNYLRAHKVA